MLGRRLRLQSFMMLVFLTMGVRSPSWGCLLLPSGYHLTPGQLHYLEGSQWDNQTLELSDEEVLRKIEEYIRSHRANLDPQELSQMILRVSRSFGIDPFLFTALVRVESLFRSDAKSPTGALGLTQLTLVGIQEVRNQLGLNPHHKSRSSQVLLRMALQSFSNNLPRLEDFISLINRSEDRKHFKQFVLDPEFSLVAGAVLLKVYLAVAKGNIKQALKMYNGSKVQDRYKREVLEHFDELKEIQLSTCREWFAESKTVLNEACVVAGRRCADQSFIQL